MTGVQTCALPIYYYVKDIQGNVKRITDIYGHVVASYTYDAWGNHTVYDEYGDVNTYQGIIGNINPIRYRGYYFDAETGLYYLQTRYYDPEIGRFISPDSTKYLDPESINGLNLYAYCLNNPVMYEDPSGHLAYPGEIHNQVVKHISGIYHYNCEQIIIYPNGGWGRADLVSNSGEVWDVKPDTERHINAGIKQVKRYTNGTWYRYDNIKLTIGGDKIKDGVFEYKSGLVTYEVEYRNAGNGVIAYKYKIKNFDIKTATVIATVLLFTILIISIASVNPAAGVVALLA